MARSIAYGPKCGYKAELDKWFECQSNYNEAVRYLIIQHIHDHGIEDMINSLPRKITDDFLSTSPYSASALRGTGAQNIDANSSPVTSCTSVEVLDTSSLEPVLEDKSDPEEIILSEEFLKAYQMDVS